MGLGGVGSEVEAHWQGKIKSQSAMKIGELLIMAEPLLLGMVMGLVPITIAGLLMAAYIQYRRGNQLGM